MKDVTTRSLVVLALVAAMGIGIPSIAIAAPTTTTTIASTTTTTVPSVSFTTEQKALEAQLANRSAQLGHLVADVTAATTLSASTTSILQARLSTEGASINALILKVPTDTTKAQLNADRSAMLKDNRVYAVMSPQVFEEIEASLVASQVTVMQGNESTLQSEVTSIVGLPGYKNALNHYNNYVSRLTNWSVKIVAVESTVLAQTPQGFPGNSKVFANQNRRILDANIDLSYAAYDASIVGLATGGYTGS